MNDNLAKSGNLISVKSRKIRGLKLGVIISKMETFADIKQGRFRRIFNRHFNPAGL